MAEMLQLLEFEWSEEEFYTFFKQVGSAMDKMFDESDYLNLAKNDLKEIEPSKGLVMNNALPTKLEQVFIPSTEPIYNSNSKKTSTFKNSSHSKKSSSISTRNSSIANPNSVSTRSSSKKSSNSTKKSV